MFFVDISAKKRQIWASEHRFREARSGARPWFMARWKAHVPFALGLTELFSPSITVSEL